ncbi:hypothetical protein D5F01_LYC23122 [Larimichthys crocea]|uniref:Uncharacterized protein n=1 Tax=Larimichthys crocea TaxID=215358 RepID=A0A6G0HKC2_LARCR|nr:hypothetical protein D5F01_LYC23122 [Larimichthys crocea]
MAEERVHLARKPHQSGSDYPPLILKKRIHRELKEKGVRFQTLFPARLRETRGRNQNLQTVEEDLLRRGHAVTTTAPPGTLMERVQRLTGTRVGRRAKTGPVEPDQSYREKLRPPPGLEGFNSRYRYGPLPPDRGDCFLRATSGGSTGSDYQTPHTDKMCSVCRCWLSQGGDIT